MNHFKPLHKMITRRDFLAQGAIAFGATMTLPTLMGLGIRSALAATRATAELPFLVFDMAGGAALPANFLVGGQGGPLDLLSSYNRLGWNPRDAGALFEGFGLPMAANASGVLKGIQSVLSAEAAKNFRMGSICHFAQDDSNENRLNAATLVQTAGLKGSFVSNGFGTETSNSGGNSESAKVDLSLRPTFVSSVDDVVGSAKLGGDAFGSFDQGALKEVARGAIRLSEIQKTLYAGIPGSGQLPDLAKTAYEASIRYVEGSENLDARKNAVASAVYGLTAETPAASPSAVAASLSMNTIVGASGPSVWTIGGCDYHDGTSTSGDAKDMEAGVEIGRAIELAHRLQRPLFFQLLTDGGVDPMEGTRMWTGDAGNKCMTVLGYYRPDRAPRLRKLQIGHYTNGQGVEDATLLGSNPLLVAYAVFANYLQCCGQLDRFSELLPSVFTEPGQLESVLIFEG